MPEADCPRILVTNIAPTTTEEAIRDFFAFCGEIIQFQIYTTSGNTGVGDGKDQAAKEAVIKFESGGAANTACLLNNALIDGRNVTVALFSLPEEQNLPQRTGKTSSTRGTGSTSSFSSVLGNISATSLALASTVVSKVQSVNEKYKVSETVSTGASNAWRESKRVASDLDTRYKVKENVSSAVQATKKKVSSIASSLSKSPQMSSSTQAEFKKH